MRRLIKITIPSLSVLLIFILPLYSEDPKVSNMKGVELGKQKKYDQALEEFTKSIDVYNVDSARTYHNKAWVTELKGDIPGAVKLYEEAVKRNPEQIRSYERLGYLYYKTGEYIKAVDIGETVLKKKPENQEVIKWLPDAYKLKQKQQQDLLAAQKEEEKKVEEKKAEEKKEPVSEEKKPEAEEWNILHVSADFMIRTAYYFKDDTGEEKGFQYVTTPGYYANVPEMFYMNFTPTKVLEIDIKAGHPYLGALSPNLIIHYETLMIIANLGKYSLGIGGMGNHYRSSFNYDGKVRKLHDIKPGLMFGLREDDAEIQFTIFPRAIIKDDDSSSGKTLDVDSAELKYDYKIDKELNIYSWMSAFDYYYFDHELKMSNYWGVYELGFGVTLGRYRLSGESERYISISVDYTGRFYMRDLNNDKPYNFANGQGWFGMNADKWFEGDPFSGYRAPAHVISLKAEEGINKYLFIYQKIFAEMVDRREDHNEFGLILGVGGVY